MDLREAKDELGYFENLMLACYLVGIHQQVEDCLLIEQAKDMDFDTYCGVDTALIFFAGFQNTVKYLETVDTPKAKEWVSQLHNWPKESIEEVDEYYATKPWWI